MTTSHFEGKDRATLNRIDPNDLDVHEVARLNQRIESMDATIVKAPRFRAEQIEPVTLFVVTVQP